MLLLWVKKNFAGIYLKKEFCRNARDICTAVEIYCRCIKNACFLHRQAGRYLIPSLPIQQHLKHPM